MAEEITQEYLDGLHYKKDVVAVAEDLGLDTEGTRAELTARILAHVAEAPAEPEPAPEPETVTEAENGEGETVEVAEVTTPQSQGSQAARTSRFVEGALPKKDHLLRPGDRAYVSPKATVDPGDKTTFHQVNR